MSQRAYLKIGDDVLPIDRNDYTIDYVDIETVRNTEAGTRSIDIIREGRKVITSNFTVTKPWVAKLRAYKKIPVLTVLYYEPSTGELEPIIAKMTKFTPSLRADKTSSTSNPLFAVAMTLEEY